MNDKDITKEVEDNNLTFEKIGKRLIRNKDVGYWLLGLILISAWSCTGLLSILQYGKWIFEPPLTLLSTIFLFFLVLLGLRYLRKVFISTVQEYRSLNERYMTTFNNKIWWLFFLLLVANQSLWFSYEYTYLIHNPEVIGTLPYRDANLGLFLLTYCTVVSTILFIIFVDLIAIGINIITFPFKIKDNIQIKIFAEDRCGGTGKIGNLVLSFVKVYFISLVLGTFGRYPGANHPTFWYYCIIVFIAWLFGVLIFFIPMHPIRNRIRHFKSRKLQEINQKLNSSLETLEIEKISQTLVLVLLKVKDEIENLWEYPINFEILKEFLFYCLLPVLSHIFMVVITDKMLL
jgi:hypothetical protein